MRRCIIMVRKPRVTGPWFHPICTSIFAQTTNYTQIIFLDDSLAGRKKPMASSFFLYINGSSKWFSLIFLIFQRQLDLWLLIVRSQVFLLTCCFQLFYQSKTLARDEKFSPMAFSNILNVYLWKKTGFLKGLTKYIKRILTPNAAIWVFFMNNFGFYSNVVLYRDENK